MTEAAMYLLISTDELLRCTLDLTAARRHARHAAERRGEQVDIWRVDGPERRPNRLMSYWPEGFMDRRLDFPDDPDYYDVPCDSEPDTFHTTSPDRPSDTDSLDGRTP